MTSLAITHIQSLVAQAATRADTGYFTHPQGAGIMLDEVVVDVATVPGESTYTVRLIVPSMIGRAGEDHTYATLHLGETPTLVAIATIVAVVEHGRGVDELLITTRDAAVRTALEI